jgi:hypothetical protein
VSKKYPYSIQLTAHERYTVGDSRSTPAPEGALLEQPLPFVMQAIAIAMRLRWKNS